VRIQRSAKAFAFGAWTGVRITLNAPNISVYPGTNQVGIFDAGQRAQPRFGALFNVADAVADYGGKAEIVPPAAGPRARRRGD
jgi:hypothetical protein